MSSTAIQLGDGSTTAAANIKLTYGSSTPTYTRNVQVNNTNPSGNAVIQTTASGVTKVASTFTLNRKACFSATLAGSTLQLQPTSVITGSGNVIIIGPGTVEFQGTNTYTGNTQINAGTPLLNNASGASINAGSITINATGTAQLGQANQIANGVGLILNGGTFNLNNFSPSSGSNTLGPLTLSASSTIDLGASATATTLKFSALSSFTTTQTLTINNYNVTDRITVTDLSNFNATNLAKINFTGYPNGARLEGNDVVPVPEPATIAVGLFAILSLIGSYCFRYAVKTA